jgi:hypothetical protein
MFSVLVFALLASAAGVHGDSCTNEVIGFQVYDSVYGLDLDPTIYNTDFEINREYLTYCRNNIQALTRSCPSTPIKCVEIKLGTQYSRKERAEPWYLFGDKDGNVGSAKLKLGLQQTLQACAYTDNDCTAPHPVCKSVKVDVVGGGKVNNCFVSDDDYNFFGKIAINTPPAQDSVDEMYFDPTGVGLNILEFADPCVDKVFFKLTGNDKTVTRTENEWPFFLFGDNSSVPYGTFPRDGVTFKSTFVKNMVYTIEVTPDDDSSKKGGAKFMFCTMNPSTGRCL